MGLIEKKLKDVDKKDQKTFLRKKYFELQLLKACDRLTDKYTSFAGLMKKTLNLCLKVFQVECAAFMRFDDDDFSDDDFIFVSRQKIPPAGLKKLSCDSLRGFLREPQPHLLENDPKPSMKKLGLKNLLILPMVLCSEIEGAFFLGSREKDFTPDHIYHLRTMSSQLDNAIVFSRTLEKQKKMQAQLNKQKREMDIIHNMSISLSLGYDFESLARKVCENVMELCNLDRSSVMVYDKAKEELQTVVIVGEMKNIRLVRLTKGRGIAGLALSSGKPILAPLGSEDERFVPYDFISIEPRKIYSLASIPLLADRKVVGVVNFSSLNPKRTIEERHLENFLAAANMISLAFQRQQYYHLSIKDELTGLNSFRYFQGRLMEEAIKANRYQFSFSLILFDIDHFKKVNDTYGHQFGNVVLKKVAEILTANIRIGADMAARYGGEEMALILPHTDQEGGKNVAERIRSQIESMNLELNGEIVPITISGGVAQFPLQAKESDQLIKIADEALYRAKESGRNRIELA